MGEFKRDTRRAPRAVDDSRVTFSIHESMKKMVRLEKEIITTNLVDISSVGCAIRSPLFLPKGVKLEITISGTNIYPQNPNLNILTEGLIKNSFMQDKGHYRLGIEFTDISEQDQKAIASYVKKKLEGH